MMTFPLHVEAFTLGDVHWASVVQLLILDLTLGLNNIVGIAPICAAIPRGERRRTLFLACIGAFMLRVAMLSAAQLLAFLPHLSLLAGAYLCYLGYRLVIDQRKKQSSSSQAASVGATQIGHWRLAWRIASVDATLSIDNVAALAAAAQAIISASAASTPFQHVFVTTSHTLPALLYCCLAVAISIPIVMSGAVAVAPLLNRAPWLSWVGAGLLVWTGFSFATADPWCDSAMLWIGGLFD